jgi:hypothetical protein
MAGAGRIDASLSQLRAADGLDPSFFQAATYEDKSRHFKPSFPRRGSRQGGHKPPKRRLPTPMWGVLEGRWKGPLILSDQVWLRISHAIASSRLVAQSPDA